LLAETDTGFGYPITRSPEAVVTKRLPDTMYTLSNSLGSQEIGIASPTYRRLRVIYSLGI
jgi:hypothetical protein